MNINIQEIEERVQKIRVAMREADVQNVILRSVPSQLYLTGSVIQGYTLVDQSQALPLFFLERPTNALIGFPEDHIFMVRKPELIPDIIDGLGLSITDRTALELGHLPMTEYERLRKLSDAGVVSSVDASTLMREVRSIKTASELTEIRRLALTHMEIYRLVPELYRGGMTDSELQHELEYQMRRRGSIGLFRAFGPRMEIFMGNVLAGTNAVNPAPYDFTMGGSGDPAMPMGAADVEIIPGTTVMVDMSGNFGVYQTDITRTYFLGELPENVIKAHQLSIELHEWFMEYAQPGAEIAEVYNHCYQRAVEEGYEANFMGTEFQAKFVGHGVGIEINEVPVLTPRWKGTFEEGMVIALEPKFVFERVGAVGLENTYIITKEGPENITPLAMDLIPLDDQSTINRSQE